MNNPSASRSPDRISAKADVTGDDILAAERTSEEVNLDAEREPLRIRYRIRFSKSGLLRWISHRDLARLWERTLRRANFLLSMTQGFHPKPRIGFPSALALGVDGCEEVVELEFAEDLHPSEVLKRLEDDQQPGLGITSVCKIPQGFKKPQLEKSEYRISIPEGLDSKDIKQAIKQLLDTQTVTVARKKKTLTFETRTQILALELTQTSIDLTLAASEAATLRPHDVLDLLGFDDWVEQGSLITRTRVHLRQDIQSDDPQIMAVSRT